MLVLFSLVLIASLLLNLFNVLRPVSQTPQLHEVLQAQLTQSADRTSSAHGQLREELRGAMQTIHGQVSSNVRALGDGQRDQLSRMQQDLDRLTASTGQHLDRMTESNAQRLDGLRAMVETRLGAMQVDNGQHIESMRATVDEKLHGTLERKLSESFTQVSERLEQVQRGLGEMQSLASGVGDLKKVFSNVKTRGEWGEIQLAALLAQCLAPAQYEQNVSPQGNAERVEFVVKMPGHGETSDP
ncbi:MAG TPA: DNA recombination protein RmuC, partial [Kofleriaceae bacterium]